MPFRNRKPIIAIFLIPCLVADPTLCGALGHPQPHIETLAPTPTVFAQQAVPPPLQFLHTILGWMSGRHLAIAQSRRVESEDVPTSVSIRKRLSRRYVLPLLAALALAAACGGRTPTSNTSMPPATPPTPTTLDPLLRSFTEKFSDLGMWNIVNIPRKWGDQDQEYHADHALASGEGLILRAEKTADGTIISGRIDSLEKRYVQYGRLKARIKLPKGQGFFPAFWLIKKDTNVNDPSQNQEIDILEYLGSRPKIAYFNVWKPGMPNGILGGEFHSVPDLSDDFHNFELELTPQALIFYVDGIERHRVSRISLPPDTPWGGTYYIILNFAIGGGWAGHPDATTQFPQEMRVTEVSYEQMSELRMAAANLAYAFQSGLASFVAMTTLLGTAGLKKLYRPPQAPPSSKTTLTAA